MNDAYLATWKRNLRDTNAEILLDVQLLNVYRRNLQHFNFSTYNFLGYHSLFGAWLFCEVRGLCNNFLQGP